MYSGGTAQPHINGKRLKDRFRSVKSMHISHEKIASQNNSAVVHDQYIFKQGSSNVISDARRDDVSAWMRLKKSYLQ